MPTAVSPHSFALSSDQVDLIHLQQERIRHRVLVIDYFAAEREHADPMISALADRLGDITEAARTIGAILQQVGNGRLPRPAVGPHHVG